MELVLHWQIYVEALPLKKGSENRTSHDVGLVIGSECLLIYFFKLVEYIGLPSCVHYGCGKVC